MGPSELLVILIIVILIYGGKRIPEIGHSLGKSIREFKKAKNEYSEPEVVDKWVKESNGKKDEGSTHNTGNICVSREVNGGVDKPASELIKEKVDRIK